MLDWRQVRACATHENSGLLQKVPGVMPYPLVVVHLLNEHLLVAVTAHPLLVMVYQRFVAIVQPLLAVIAHPAA